MNEESGILMAWKGQASIRPILEKLQQDGYVTFLFWGAIITYCPFTCIQRFRPDRLKR